MMKAIFLDRGTFPPSVRIKPPEKIAYWKEFQQTNDSDIIQHCHNANIILTNKVTLNRSTLLQLPNLKLIAVTATDTNNIDLDTCRELNIPVVNATDYGTQSVAEHVLMLMLTMARNFNTYQNANKNQSWAHSPYFCDRVAPIQQLSAKTLTIIGQGTLGKAVAHLAQGFGMTIIFAEHRGVTPIRQGYTRFEDALAQADYLSLHCPLTPDTENLINPTTIKLLKNTVTLINTGRGGLIDEHAVLDALKTHRIGGAALDVATTEPPQLHDPIWQLAAHPNVILTPHGAWASDEEMQVLIDQIMHKIERFIDGKSINQVAN